MILRLRPRRDRPLLERVEQLAAEILAQAKELEEEDGDGRAT